jgi:hypothetical protein
LLRADIGRFDPVRIDRECALILQVIFSAAAASVATLQALIRDDKPDSRFAVFPVLEARKGLPR